MAIVIETPRGRVYHGKDGKAVLEWNTNFKPKWTRRFTLAQKYVDSAVLNDCEPYTPLLTGMMIKSGILATEPGSGLVQWIAPYSRRQYYSRREPGSQTGPLRGPYWFERAKAVHKTQWIAGAKRIAGGGE